MAAVGRDSPSFFQTSRLFESMTITMLLYNTVQAARQWAQP